MKRKRRLSIRCAMLSVLPVIKLSIATTSHPSASRRSQRCEPRKPAPPVTKTRGIISLLMTLFHTDREWPRPVSSIANAPVPVNVTGRGLSPLREGNRRSVPFDGQTALCYNFGDIYLKLDSVFRLPRWLSLIFLLTLDNSSCYLASSRRQTVMQKPVSRAILSQTCS